MKLLPHAVGVVMLPVLLSGCAANSAPAATATVTVTAAAAPTSPPPTLGAADAAPWDLHAVCATEAEVSTLEVWRRHQTEAGLLSTRESAAITQGIAVQYLEMREFTTSSVVQHQVDALANAAGTLDDPKIDLSSTAVRTARTGITNACRENGLTIGIYAQGG